MPYPHPKGYVCARASEPIVIDGDLTKPVWQAAPWSEDFLDIEGETRPAPRFRTRMKMLWDNTFFYIAAELEEPDIWATLTEHDSVIFYDNDFEIFLDPDGDNHDYGEFEMNALNTTWDLRLPKPYRDGGPALNEWEIEGIKTAVKVFGTLNDARDRDHGWTLELALPWSGLKTLQGGDCPEVGQQWRVNFSRVEWDIEPVDNFPYPVDNSTLPVDNSGKVPAPYQKIPSTPEYNWVWSPQWAIDMHRPEWWGYVQFEESPDVPFRPDPDWESRCHLMELYHAEKHPEGWSATKGNLTVTHDSRIRATNLVYS
ncbi:carbohydrate-binding family 9-like protein [Armatimonas sp.]|uniref:carbohydrate-binding family 9-like protein n=1 Tax=Armatimonas sp. TaxID=1872638 RepID=UPI003751A354